MYNSKPIIMKALKVTMLLAIFCLTFSGQSSDVKSTETNDNFKTNKVEFKDIVLGKAKKDLPPRA